MCIFKNGYKVTISYAKEEDFCFVQQYQKELYKILNKYNRSNKGSKTISKEKYNELLLEEDKLFFTRFMKIELEDLCVGYIKITRLKQYLVINEIFVDKSFRKSGIGAVAFECLIEDIARDLKIRIMELSVDHANQRAIKFYKKLGFEITSNEMSTNIFIMKRNVEAKDENNSTSETRAI